MKPNRVTYTPKKKARKTVELAWGRLQSLNLGESRSVRIKHKAFITEASV
jgi:hypothetical protein